MIALLFKCQQAGDKISERGRSYLGIRKAVHLEAWMGQLDKRGWRHPSKSLVVKQKGEHLAERGLTRLDSWAARLTAQRGLHAPWVVRREGLLVDWLPNAHNIASVLCAGRGFPQHVTSTGALLSEGRLLALVKASPDEIEAVLDGHGYRHGAIDVYACGNVVSGQN